MRCFSAFKGTIAKVRALWALKVRGGIVAGKKKGREYYLAKIEQAETFARKVSDNSARESLEKIAQGYRALLRRLESLKV